MSVGPTPFSRAVISHARQLRAARTTTFSTRRGRFAADSLNDGEAGVGSTPRPRKCTVLVGDLHGQLSKLTSLWEQLEHNLGVGPFSVARVVFLGDYVDRGPDSRGVLEWLSTLGQRHAHQEHVFLSGNHDFGMVSFLGLCASRTKCGTSGGYAPWRTEPELWAGEGCVEMHLQGRRWGAIGSPSCRNVFDSGPTFASYGVQDGDREALLSVLPHHHQRFLAGLQWVHDCHLPPDPVLPGTSRLIAVHAGLDTSSCLDGQLRVLLDRDDSEPWIEPLQGRGNVLGLHPELPDNVVLVSGHHGSLRVSGRRMIIDTCGGFDEQPLSAMCLPGQRLVSSIESEESLVL